MQVQSPYYMLITPRRRQIYFKPKIPKPIIFKTDWSWAKMVDFAKHES